MKWIYFNEQTEGSRKLAEEIREKLLTNLEFAEDPFKELQKLFNEIDRNGSNCLSREELALLMEKLEVNFSQKKWQQIYHEIDRNYDDAISFHEFMLFLFNAQIPESVSGEIVFLKSLELIAPVLCIISLEWIKRSQRAVRAR